MAGDASERVVHIGEGGDGIGSVRLLPVARKVDGCLQCFAQATVADIRQDDLVDERSHVGAGELRIGLALGRSVGESEQSAWSRIEVAGEPEHGFLHCRVHARRVFEAQPTSAGTAQEGVDGIGHHSTLPDSCTATPPPVTPDRGSSFQKGGLSGSGMNPMVTGGGVSV
ncbi:MAG: hypothetical protein DI573_04445 [Microbacterium sp.]|nr:MAG: hypothetical protein DI573_04445 [Microbacterium sp.]